MENVVKNLGLFVMPSPLWGVHVDPHNEFIALIHLNVFNKKISIDKSLLVLEEEETVKAYTFINGEEITIPNILYDVKLVSDLSLLLQLLHELKVCGNFGIEGSQKCLKFANSSSYLCSVCEGTNAEFFDYEENEFNHVKLEALPECDVSLKEPHLKEHANEKTKKKSKLLKEKRTLCNVCGKTFGPFYIKDHMLTHTLEKPFECKICKKRFSKSYNLKMHEFTHTGKRPFMCSKCGKSYAAQSNLRTHIISAHRDVKRHTCETCNMTFVHPRYLKMHLRTHTGEKPFSCDICMKTFSQRVHLTVHKRIHTGEKPHICTICRKGFTTTGNLASHKKTHYKQLNDEVLLQQ